MSDNQMLYCLIAFILGWFVSRHMGNGFRVGCVNMKDFYESTKKTVSPKLEELGEKMGKLGKDMKKEISSQKKLLQLCQCTNALNEHCSSENTLSTLSTCGICLGANQEKLKKAGCTEDQMKKWCQPV